MRALSMSPTGWEPDLPSLPPALLAFIPRLPSSGGAQGFGLTSGSTREFGIRLAVGSQPRHLLIRVMREGGAMAIAGLAVWFAGGFELAQLAAAFLEI